MSSSLRFKSIDDIGKHCRIREQISTSIKLGRQDGPASPQVTSPLVCSLPASPAGGLSNTPGKAKKKRKNEIEGDEQASLLKSFRSLFPFYGAMLIHIPNGGSRKNAYEGWRLKEQGVKSGVSDLNLPVARGGYFGLWIEFKASPPNNSPVSDSQKEWIDLMQGQGYRAEVAIGEAAALKALCDYMAMPQTIALQLNK